MSVRLESFIDQCSSYNELVHFADTNFCTNLYAAPNWANNIHDIKDMYDYASKAGNINVLQWLIEYDSSVFGGRQSIELAICHNHFHVLKWFKTNNYTKWHKETYACIIAARYSRLDMLKWLVEMGCPLTIEVCEGAINPVEWHTVFEQDILIMLQWLREHDCPWEDSMIVIGAAGKGYIRILQWTIGLWSTSLWRGWDYKNKVQRRFSLLTANFFMEISAGAISIAIARNQFHSIMWLLAHKPKADFPYDIIRALGLFFHQNYYDVNCHLVNALGYNCESLSTKQWVTTIDTETQQLPLAPDLHQLIKHYI